MKKFIIIICVLFCVTTQIKAQGTTATPYDTTGWSIPAAYSKFFHFYIYKLLSNPGGRINLNTVRMDSLFKALVVYTDTLQYALVIDTAIVKGNYVLKTSNYATGTGQFTTTATVDSFQVSPVNLSPTKDLFFLTPLYGTLPASANDVLSYKVNGKKLIVGRPSGGTSGLIFVYHWIRRY